MAKLQINCVPCVEPGQALRNAHHAESLGLPRFAMKERPPLLVLGGGLSIRDHIEEVRASTADKWLVGSAFRWWHEQGVEGTFFSVHPSPASVQNVNGVSRALLATQTDPAVFAMLERAEVEVFDLIADLKGGHGVTTATCAPMLAVSMGYTDITFYGCEGNYGHSTHLYMSVDDQYMMKVRCDGQDFLTGAEFLMQSEFLAAALRSYPGMFHEKSGGLLAAMLRNPDYDVTHISRVLHDSMKGAHV